jgi:hypothetical protein
MPPNAVRYTTKPRPSGTGYRHVQGLRGDEAKRENTQAAFNPFKRSIAAAHLEIQGVAKTLMVTLDRFENWIETFVLLVLVCFTHLGIRTNSLIAILILKVSTV